MRQISEHGLKLVRDHEGFCATPIALKGKSWLVGFGHVRVGAPGDPVSAEEAEALLAADMSAIASVVDGAVRVDLTQSQFDALASFAFSIGASAFLKSQALRRVNKKDFIAAACAMDAWRKTAINGELEVLDALVRRRAAEKALFLQDVACAPTPSALARPKLDHAASVLGTPVSSAIAPTVAAAPPKPRTAAEIIADVLRAEPATEAVLRAAPAPENVVLDEITSANAKPVARLAETPRRAWLKLPAFDFKRGGEYFGLLALFAFGMALIALGGSVLLGGGFDIAAMLGGAALATPGLAATLIASAGILQGAHQI
jgi:lysozyme